MTIFSLIAFSVSLTCLILGFIILSRDRKSSSHRLFFLICLSLSLLNLVSIPAYSSAEKSGVMFWTEVAAWFVNPFYAVNLHFYLVLVFKKKIKSWKLVIIYAPSVLINSFFLVSPYSILDYVQYQGQWKLIPAYANPCFYAASGYVLLYAFITVLVILIYMRRAVLNKERKQAAWLMMNLIISTIIGTAGLWVIPYFNYRIPNIGPTYHLFYAAGLFYSVYRFRFMELSSSIVADEIISHINDMVILLGKKLEIKSVNSAAARSLGLGISDMAGKFFPDCVNNRNVIVNALSRIEGGADAVNGIPTSYKAAAEPVFASSYIAAVKDSFNDIIGFLVISKENRGRKEFRKLYKLTERELEIVDLTTAGLSSREIGKQLSISDRTVQSHQEHVYQKLGVSGKVDLIKLASIFDLEKEKSESE